MKKQRTMILLSSLEPWSMAESVGAPSLYETLKGYAKAGWKVIYLTSYKRYLGGGSHEKSIDCSIDNVETHRFHIPALLCFAGSRIQLKANRLCLFPFAAAKALETLLARACCDLIYAYEEGAILAIDLLRKTRKIHIPVLNRFQGTIVGGAYRELHLLLRKMESWLALTRPADLFVMTDDGTNGKAALQYWNRYASDDKLLFLRNGIDLSLSQVNTSRSRILERFDLNPNYFYLLMVSRLTGWKRIDRGIRLMGDIKTSDPEVRLLIVGDGEARDALKNLCASLSLQDRVQFMGAMPRRQVGLLMNAADIFLSLNDISNCGNPLFEALLCGRPAVTIANGGTHKVVTDGSNGRLVSPGDGDLLRRVVSELIRSSNQRSRLSEGARSWAHNNLYTWDARMDMEISWVRERLDAKSDGLCPQTPMV